MNVCEITKRGVISPKSTPEYRRRVEGGGATWIAIPSRNSSALGVWGNFEEHHGEKRDGSISFVRNGRQKTGRKKSSSSQDLNTQVSGKQK